MIPPCARMHGRPPENNIEASKHNYLYPDISIQLYIISFITGDYATGTFWAEVWAITEQAIMIKYWWVALDFLV